MQFAFDMMTFFLVCGAFPCVVNDKQLLSFSRAADSDGKKHNTDKIHTDRGLLSNASRLALRRHCSGSCLSLSNLSDNLLLVQ